MALKFRRGSTGDKSGSLAYGEPYVNTTLGTLQIGGNSGDITLLINSSSQGISGSSLDITGNAKIDGNLVLGGNITIGDQTTDTLAVNANLSSSLIPSVANAFDLGSEANFWRDIYVSTGSIKFVGTGGTVVGTVSATSLNSNTQSINLLNSYTASNNTNISAIHTSTSSLNEFSASVRASGSIINTFTSSVNTSTSSLNDFSASVIATGSIINTFTSSVNSYTSSNNTNISAIHTSTGSLNSYTSSNTTNIDAIHTSTSSLNTFSSSANARLNLIETSTSSLNTFTSSLLTAVELTGSNLTVKGDLLVKGTTTNIDSTTLNIGDNIISLNGTGTTNAGIVVRDATAATTISGSFLWDTSNDYWIAGPVGSEQRVVRETEFNNAVTRIGNVEISTASLNSYTSSNDTKISAIHTSTSSLNDFSASVIATGSIINTFTSSVNTSTSSLNAFSASVIATGSIINTFTSSVNSSTSSLNDFSASVIATGSIMNTFTSSVNSFSASVIATGSIINTFTSSLNSFSASVIATGSIINTFTSSVNTSTSSLNSFTSSIDTTIKSKLNNDGVISGSSQITTLPSVDTDDLTEGVSNKYYTDVRVKTKLDAEGVISGSSQVFSGISGDVLIASNGVATIQANSVALGTDTTGDYVASLVAGSGITLTNNSGEGATPTVALTNTAITIAGTSTSLGGSISAATIGNAIGAFSGSSQVAHNSTTGYEANRHIDHSAVSISAGTGLTGGGDITTTRTLSIDSTVATLTGAQVLTNKTISGASNTLSNIGNGSLTNSSVTVTAGTGLSGGGAVSLGGSVTLSNAGVTSNVAGTGISVSGATGAVTITNTGVTSAVAGTGVGVSAGTGAVTISIGQSVATSANAQFNSLGIGMAASATAGRIDATNDIVAYSSSDKRFKDNIKPIENPLEKINKISGNTFDWKEENKIEHGYEGNDVGVIAQEIESVLPQIVTTRESGYKAVKYDKLVALLIEGIKEQQIQINDMKVEIENLKKQKGL